MTELATARIEKKILRRRNRLLHLMRRGGMFSRLALARSLAQSNALIGNDVEALLEQGFLVERVSPHGAPPSALLMIDTR